MRILSRFGQSSFEMIAIMTVLFMIVIGAFGFIQGRTYAVMTDKNAQQLESIGNIIESEIGLAERVHADYYRLFSIPQTVDGNNYSISLVNKTDVVLKMGDIEYFVFLDTDMYGDFNKGDNIIRKADDYVVVNYVCQLGLPDVECENDTDAVCNDGEPTTVDSCNSVCQCENNVPTGCGNGFIEASEQCDSPGLFNDNNCTQTPGPKCRGLKTGTRDLFGNCLSTCECGEDSYLYSCVKDSCGASCSTNDDCVDTDPGTTDTCTPDCGCAHVLTAECGNNIFEPWNGEICDAPAFPHAQNILCTAAESTCIPGNHNESRVLNGTCESTCTCSYTTTDACVKDTCGATCAIATQATDCNTVLDTCNGQLTVQRTLPGTCNSAGCSCSYTTNHPGTCILGNSCGAECTVATQATDCNTPLNTCSGVRTVQRTLPGTCTAGCDCSYETSTPRCVSSSCGATCNEGEVVSPNPPTYCEAYGCIRP